MEKILTGLLENMMSQFELYQRVLSLASEKKSVLVKGDIHQLERITKEEEGLILQVGRLEEQRLSLQRDIAGHFALSAADLTVSDIIDRVEEPISAQFRHVVENMTDVLKKLAETNEANTELVRNSLEFVNFYFNVLTDNDSTPSYGEKEDSQKGNAAKIFDRKV
ncbi:flagellar protein FlgN [Phosphitispora sp. TUW77]|uniref:flagellar protein FlgN n=1 Tax=Phosphitispora sp. TUW77 TaxID=3152361 RepID=UPI003AB1BAFB